MEWTSEKPTMQGYYWYRHIYPDGYICAPSPVRVYDSGYGYLAVQDMSSCPDIRLDDLHGVWLKLDVPAV